MMDDYQGRLDALKASLAQLDQTIVDKRAKDYLLRPASNSLSDIEILYLPGARNALTP